MLTNTAPSSMYVKVSSLTYRCNLCQLISLYGQYEEFACCGTVFHWDYTDRRYVAR